MRVNKIRKEPKNGRQNSTSRSAKRYATPTELKRRLGITDTTRDSTLWHLLHVASRIVEGHCARNFYVTSESKRFDVRDRHGVQVDDDANIRAGQTILVGNEQMFVKQVGASVLNVERGMNGTSAVVHDDGSLLKALSYPAEVVEATLLVAVDRWRPTRRYRALERYRHRHPRRTLRPFRRYLPIVSTVSEVEDMRAINGG